MVRGFVAISAAALALGACNKPATPVVALATSSPATPAPVADGWTVLPAPAVATATRTVMMKGGGELGMILSCDFRPSKDATLNGFWLKLALELKDAGGPSLGLDPLKTENQNARFTAVRSSGEAGGMLLKITDPTHFVYENNQNDEYDQKNDDPARVELAKSFELPLSDGRVVTIDLLRGDAGYKALLTQCAGLAPK